MESGSCELHFLATLAQETGVWKNAVLSTILSQEPLDKEKGKFPEGQRKQESLTMKNKYLNLFGYVFSQDVSNEARMLLCEDLKALHKLFVEEDVFIGI